jgi:aminoglycoside phosphotransferase (APT) family kinase protein
MADLSPDSLQAIVRRHRADLDGPVTAEPITTGKFNTSYFVTAGGEELVLRIAPPRDSVFVFYERDMMRQESGIHACLRERTSVPAAEIFAYDDSLGLIDRDFLVMERLPGVALSDAPGTDFDTVLRQVGRYLAESHGLTADTYGYIGEHRPMEPQASWVDAFEMMWNRLIDDIVSVGHYDGEESGLFRSLLNRHIGLFDRPVDSCLLHMDIWHQNILVDGGGVVTGIVDWDRALWGDVEIEFAVLDYCGISEPAFWEGYGQERDLSPEARVRQVFNLLYELQKYIVIREGRNHDSASARRHKAQVFQIVRQAFPT